MENRTGYDTLDIVRFIRAGLRATRTPKDVRVRVVTAPQRSRGCADVGGRRMVLALNAPWYCDRNDCLRRLARMFVHECEHIKGVPHSRMCRHVCRRGVCRKNCDLLYSYGPTPRWARGTRIRYHGRAPRQLDLLG